MLRRRSRDRFGQKFHNYYMKKQRPWQPNSKQSYVVCRLGNIYWGSRFHNFQRLRGLGGQGAELDILRHWDLRGWGGKMRPAGSGGKMVLSSGPVCSRPRLPALIPLAPEPRHGGGHRTTRIHDPPYPGSEQSCCPCFLTGQFETKAAQISVDMAFQGGVDFFFRPHHVHSLEEVF